jgi:hypothetical protein
LDLVFPSDVIALTIIAASIAAIILQLLGIFFAEEIEELILIPCKNMKAIQFPFQFISFGAVIFCFRE